MSSMRPGWVGFQPRSSWVMVLEAGMSVLSKRTSMPSYSPAGKDLAGRARGRAVGPADSPAGTPSAPAALGPAPGGGLLVTHPRKTPGGLLLAGGEPGGP